MDSTLNMSTDSHLTFDALLGEHRGILAKVVSVYARDGEDRADLTQEIAAQLWRAWPRYDPERPFSTWMYRIALNVAISHLRGQVQRRERTVPWEEDLHGLSADAGDPHEARDGLRVLHRFMTTLEPLNRALLVLYLEEHSTREIAEVLGMRESAVTTRISRLKQRIRDYAAPAGND
jgi:RNA polymerase sigma-70 factor (ECF subfamily)